MVPLLQVLPQPPQLALSEEASTHWPEQAIWPIGQDTAWQLPDVHTWLFAQAFPHMPQLLRSVPTAVHTPLHNISPMGH